MKSGRPKRKRRYKTLTDIEISNRREFREAAWKQRVCAVCGRGGEFDAHHVVEKQWFRIHGKMGSVWDTRNVLRLCPRCHGQHTVAAERVPLRKLRDENIAFAFEIMGAAAYHYLYRLYDGELDERLETQLALIEGEGTDDQQSSAAI